MLPTFLTDGGPVIWLILIAAAIALVVFIERACTATVRKSIPRNSSTACAMCS